MFPVPPYLLAHFGKSQLWHASTLLFAFFLTERCGLRPLDAGWIMGLSLFANGGIDLAVGRWGRTRIVSAAAAGRMQAVFAPVSAAFFILFCATALLPPPIRLGWALAMLLGFRFSYPLLDVPQNALVALIEPSPKGRQRLLAGRNIASQVANLAVSFAAAPLLIVGGTDSTYLPWAVLVGVFACASAIALTRVRTGKASAPFADCVAPPVPSFAMLALVLAVMVMAGTIFRIMAPYFEAFAAPQTHFLLWAAAGTLVAQPLWLVAIRRTGSAAASGGVAGLLIASSLVLLTPLRGEAIGAALAALGYGIGTGSLWLALWSAMIAHAGDRDAILCVSGVTCVSKMSQGIAALLVGYLLQDTNYRATLSDALSPVSLLMAGALLAIAACCAALTIAGRSPGPYAGRQGGHRGHRNANYEPAA